MASIISAGTTSATALNMSADTTGILQLASNNGTVALTINTSQYVGINTTPTNVFHTLGANATGATTLADSVTVAKLRFQSASNSSLSLFQGTTGSGPAWYLQIANGAGSGTYPIALNPFGGVVGVGTTDPQANFQVNASNFALANTYNTQTSNLAVRTTNAQAANVGGEIALGGYSNDAATQVQDFVRLHGKKTNSTSTNVSGYFAVEVAYDGGPAPYMFERMRILDTGPVLIGTTVAMEGYGNNNSGITIRSTGAASVFSNNSSDYGLVLNKTTYQSGSTSYQVNFRTLNQSVGGIFTDNASTTYATSSDYRLKESVSPLVGALNKVALLKPVTYKWKADGSNGEGFIAHELAEVCPQAVVGTKDQMRDEPYEITPAVKDESGNIITEAVMGTRSVPDYQSIDTSFLVATLTAAIQELNAKVTALENK